MTKTISQQESTAISYLRVAAMMSIVACHFMQALGSHWAWVFNVGVQVFLLISGYLYGHKHIDNWREWFGKRVVRIYIPYLLFIVAIIPAYLVAGLMSVKNVIAYLFDIQGVVGGGKRSRSSVVYDGHRALLCHNTPFAVDKRVWKVSDMGGYSGDGSDTASFSRPRSQGIMVLPLCHRVLPCIVKRTGKVVRRYIDDICSCLAFAAI